MLNRFAPLVPLALVTLLFGCATHPQQVVEQQKSQFTQWASVAEVMAYYEQLKKTFKVQIKVARP